MSGRDEHPRRRPVQARSTATVQAVLDAARAVLNAGGELTARSIAERAGIAAPTVYRYFADVKAVVDALVGEHAAAAEAMVAEVLAADDGADVGVAFSRVLDGYLRLYQARPEFTVMWSSTELAERQRAVEEQSDHALAGRLAAHLVAGGAVPRPQRDRFARRVALHWRMAGVALGAALRASRPAERREADRDLHDFVAYAADQCLRSAPGHPRRTAAPRPTG